MLAASPSSLETKCGRRPAVGKGTGAPEAARMPGATRLRNGRARCGWAPCRQNERERRMRRGRSVTMVRSTHPEGAATHVAHLVEVGVGAARARARGLVWRIAVREDGPRS